MTPVRGLAALAVSTGLALLAGLALVPPSVGGPAASSALPRTLAQAPSVVVLGVAGLRWSDVGPRTPALQALAQRGAVGALSVKALPAVSCPADGWATLGAGTRAEAFEVSCSGTVADVEQQKRRNAATRDGAVVGALRDALDVPVVAEGPGARLALGLPPSPEQPPASQAGGAVRLVEVGTVQRHDGQRQLTRLDAAIGVRLARLPSTTDVLVVGVSGSPGDRTAHLHVAIAAGPSFPRGALRSASTRRAPFVQLVDVAPTVLALTGEPVPASMDGQPWQVVGDAPTVDELVDLDDRAVTAKRVTVPFHVVLVATLLVLWTALRRRPGAAGFVALAGTAAPGASYVAQLVPWWRTPAPLLALLAVVAVLSVAAAGLGRRVGAVCAMTVAVLVADLLAGAPLQLDSVAGYSPLVAGRFAGLGNVAFGVYGTAWLLLAAALASRLPPRRAGLLVAGLGAVAVTVAGAPAWGSDVGGVLALLPAFVVLALLVVGARVTAGRLLLAGAAAALVVAGFALLDLARPAPERTHLGRFAADVRDGTAGELLVRKASAVLGLLFANPVTAALPLLVAAAVWMVLRPPAPLRRAFHDEPWVRQGLTAVGVMSLLGFLVNDSGAAVPALALLVAIPATVAVAFRSERVRAPGPAAGRAPVD